MANNIQFCNHYPCIIGNTKPVSRFYRLRYPIRVSPLRLCCQYLQRTLGLPLNINAAYSVTVNNYG